MGTSTRSFAVAGVVLFCFFADAMLGVSAVGQRAGEEGFGIIAEAAGRAFPQRHLLQTLHQCPIDFATKNYTPITSVCNGSDPNPTLCCSSFIAFACPYAQYLNDPTTNCASTFFSYLNLAGNYPPALFSSLCHGDQVGLPCPSNAPAPAPSSVPGTIPSGAAAPALGPEAGPYGAEEPAEAPAPMSSGAFRHHGGAAAATLLVVSVVFATLFL